MYLSSLVPSKKIELGQSKNNIHESEAIKALPSQFDWSTQNVIGPILDQERVSSSSEYMSS